MTWLRTLWWAVLLACAAPAVVLTTLRLLQSGDGAPRSGWAIRAVSFTPLAVLPYVVVLALLVVAAVRSGLLLRWPFGVAAIGRYVAILAVVVALGLHGWWFAPALVGGQPDPVEGVRPVTVLSLNLLGGRADERAVVRLARRTDVDVLVLTEVTPATVRALGRAGLERHWPHRAGAPAEGAVGTMVISRLPLGPARELPTRFGTWRVDVAAPGGDLTLIAAHPTPPVRRADWAADWDVLVAAASQRPDLIVGDLNATPDHRPLHLLADAGLRTSTDLANSGWDPTWPANGAFYRVLPPVVQIDHILAGPRLVVLSSRTVEVDGTDHLGVLARVAPAE